MILLYLAVLPVIILAGYIYKKDAIEPEPKGLLIKSFILGGLTIIPAIILELLFGAVIQEALHPILSNFVGVALVEEACKMMILMLVIWKNKEFNYRFDGIVYAVFVSLGFACFENILYVLENGIGTAILRALTAVPGHTIFAVFMGYYMGMAKLCEVTGMLSDVKKNKVMMLLVPTLLHGFYDYAASSNKTILFMVFWVFLLVMDVIALKRVKKSAREDIPLFYQ